MALVVARAAVIEDVQLGQVHRTKPHTLANREEGSWILGYNGGAKMVFGEGYGSVVHDAAVVIRQPLVRFVQGSNTEVQLTS